MLNLVCFRFNYVSDSEYLYTPINGAAKAEKRSMKRNFPNDEENLFIFTRKLDFEGFLQVILTDASHASNVYTEDGITSAILVDGIIKDFETSDKRNDISFSDVCSKWNGSCIENQILHILNYDSSNINSESIHFPVYNSIFLGHELGNVKTDSNGIIQKVEAIMLTYHVQYLGKTTRKRSEI